METTKKMIMGIMGVCLILITIAFTGAIGVGCSYSTEVPLNMYPGQERVIPLTLQNPDIDGEASLKGNLINGGEIASLNEGLYAVKKGELVIADLKLKIPVSAEIGKIYPIKYQFEQVAGAGGSGVGFAQVITRDFNVVVVEKPAEPVDEPAPEPVNKGLNFWWIALVILIIIAAIVVYVVIKKRKN